MRYYDILVDAKKKKISNISQQHSNKYGNNLDIKTKKMEY